MSERVFNTAVGSYFQGWVPGFRDNHDRYYVPKPNVDISKTASINLRSHAPMNNMLVYDQGALNSCVANAASFAFWYELRKAGDKGVETEGPSRYFLWWNALKGDTIEEFRTGPLANDGTWNRHAMKLLHQVGVCPESMLHYVKNPASMHMSMAQYKNFLDQQLQHEPPKKCYDDAKHHTIGAYYRLDADRAVDQDTQARTVREMDAVGELCLENVKRCLVDDHPVVLAFRFYWDEIPWDRSTGAIWSLPNIWAGPNPVAKSRHSDPESNFGGHAVVAIGYDDSKQSILCQNSWGVKKYGFDSQGGLFYMPYAWVKDFAATNDFWTCRLKPGDQYLSEDEVNARVRDKIKQMKGEHSQAEQPRAIAPMGVSNSASGGHDDDEEADPSKSRCACC